MTGAFGYKIGKKIRLMQVEKHVDILWQTCVRELYILMKHYGTTEALQEAFGKLKDAKGKPTHNALERCKYFTDDKTPNSVDWCQLTKYCQHSYINILETGYFLNNGTKEGLIFLLDLNTNTVQLYEKEKIYEKANLAEIMEFDDMPTISLQTILDEMKQRYTNYETKVHIINQELQKIETMVQKTKELGSDQNIIAKANAMKDTLLWDKKKVDMEYRFFYHRLIALDMIEH